VCYNPESGGYCALGAIARAAYPKAKDEDIDSIAYAGVGTTMMQIAASPARRRSASLTLATSKL
jgi:hypothetical protein